MKKNRKMLGLAAAALLAVAPVVASTVPVNADTTVNLVTPGNNNNNTPSTPTPIQQGAANFTYGTNVIANGNSVPYTFTVGESKDGKTEPITVQAITDAINKAGIGYQETVDGTTTFNQINNVSTSYVSEQLSKISGVKIGTGAKDKGVVTGLPSTFNITLATNNKSGEMITALVPFVVSSSGNQQDATAPQFKVTTTKNGTTNNNDSLQKYYTVAAGSNFNPTDFYTSDGEHVVITAHQAENNQITAPITTSGAVNTSEEGRYYTVTLTAKNDAGKTTTKSFTVLVVPNGQKALEVDTPTYNIYGGNVQATGNTLKAGTKIYVGSITRSINNVSYTKISTSSKADADSGNLWAQTASLAAKPAGDTNVEKHTVMVTSRAYDKDGKYLGNTYNAYTTIDIVPTVQTINGKKYYKVANKNEYVRTTNITGNQRTLRHNAYIYWSSYRRTPGTGKMYKGQTVTTYGASMRFRNGKKYYRIQGCRDNNKRYIKAANF